MRGYDENLYKSYFPISVTVSLLKENDSASLNSGDEVLIGDVQPSIGWHLFRRSEIS